MQIEERNSYERGVFDRFISLYPFFPKGKIEKSESPDFLLKISRKKTIGIELTSLQEPFVMNNFLNLLAKKEEKITLYQKKKLFQIWLLVSCTDISATEKKHCQNSNLQSGFDKIFVLTEYRNMLIEVK